MYIDSRGDSSSWSDGEDGKDGSFSTTKCSNQLRSKNYLEASCPLICLFNFLMRNNFKIFFHCNLAH